MFRIPLCHTLQKDLSYLQTQMYYFRTAATLKTLGAFPLSHHLSSSLFTLSLHQALITLQILGVFDCL